MPRASEYRPVSSNCWRSRSKGRYEGLGAHLSTRAGTGGITVKNARIATILAVALAFPAIRAVSAAGTTAVWLPGKVRVFGPLALPTAIVAALLAVYFEWREKLRRQMRAERKEYCEAA